MDRGRTRRSSYSSDVSAPDHDYGRLCSDAEAFDVEHLLEKARFLRVHIESVNLPREFVDHLTRHREQTGGVILEYTIPCLDSMPSSMKKRVKIPAKCFVANAILFENRRVLMLRNWHPEMTQFWRKSTLIFRLYTQMPNTRYLGKTEIPLKNLLIPPFVIDGDFPFSGQVRLDLGSSLTSWQEHVARCQPHPDVNGIGVSGERRVGVVRAQQARPRSPQVRRLCREEQKRPSEQRNGNRTSLCRPQKWSFHCGNQRVSSRSSSSSPSRFSPPAMLPSRIASPPAIFGDSFRLRLTVHGASRLPHVKGPNGAPELPSTFVSIQGDDHVEKSSVIRRCTHPTWDWPVQLTVGNSRKNIVVRLWHRCAIEGDRILGFVSLDVPEATFVDTGPVDYEMADLSDSYGGYLTISMSPVSRTLDRPIRRTPPPAIPSPHPPLLNLSESGLESRTVLTEKLRRNIDELDYLVRHLPQ